VAEFAQEVIGKLFSTSDESDPQGHPVGDKMVVGLHQYLLDEAIKKIKSLNPENIRGALASGKGEIEVSSRLALTPHQKQSLNELFLGIAAQTATPGGKGSVLPDSIKLTEKPPDSKYLAGVSIKIGGMVIDATLNNRLKEIISEITK
jgi:F0F1-type ATP synthase delta subunit